MDYQTKRQESGTINEGNLPVQNKKKKSCKKKNKNS